MSWRIAPLLCLGAALLAYGALNADVWQSRELARKQVPAGYVIPSKYSRILAMGQHGLLSDYLFLKTATFVGGRGVVEQTMDDEDWRYISGSLEVITDLDPYFADPYVVAEGLLAWDAGLPELANRLLVKGMRYRDRDWRLPFYIGFNNFYFLRNYQVASEYIMQASRLEGSPEYLKTLGARLAYYGGKSKTALLFLKQMLAEDNDPLLNKRLSIRLQALEGATQIEEALERYQEDQGRLPALLTDLVSFGYLQEMPLEPYGGEWVRSKDGRVFSTSRFAFTGISKDEPSLKKSDQEKNASP